jgi:hypothetical protein
VPVSEKCANSKSDLVIRFVVLFAQGRKLIFLILGMTWFIILPYSRQQLGAVIQSTINPGLNYNPGLALNPALNNRPLMFN